jgi:hypothetical protein
MSYVLRLFENGVEVHSSAVAIVPGAQNYPAPGKQLMTTG